MASKNRRVSTRVWLRKALAKKGQFVTDTLTWAYSDNGNRLIASNGYAMHIDENGDYLPGTFYDGKNPLPVYGEYPDITRMLEMCAIAKPLIVDAASMWAGMHLLMHNLRRKEDNVVMADLVENHDTLDITITRFVKEGDNIVIGPVQAKITNPFLRQNIAKGKVDAWYLYGALSGLKHESTIEVTLSTYQPNMLKSNERTAIIMPLEQN